MPNVSAKARRFAANLNRDHLNMIIQGFAAKKVGELVEISTIASERTCNELVELGIFKSAHGTLCYFELADEVLAADVAAVLAENG